MKPLLEPCPETTIHGVTRKRWGYSGCILEQFDVDRLTARGLDWEKDVMPDGRLKHPRFRAKRNKNRAIAIQKLTDIQSTTTDALEEKYKSLPEPRPPYFQWAAQEEVFAHYRNLKEISLCARRDCDKIKASSVLLEHGLAKPKQTVENIIREPEEEVPMERLLEIALEQSGIEPEKFKKFLASQAN